MKLHLLAGGRLRMRRSIYVPGAAREEMIELPVHASLMRHPQGNVLFDSGCSPEAAASPERRWGDLAKVMTPIFAPEQTVLTELRNLELSPGDIDVVICSHLHPDHCGCNEHFRRATIFCHAAEVAAAKAEGSEQQGYLPREWRQPQGFETFQSEYDLFDDERIILMPMPGHTPGLTVARVGLDRDGTFILASDAAPLQSNIDTMTPPKNTWNMDMAADALAQLRRFRDQGDTVISGHDDEQWQRLRKGMAYYE